MMVSKINDYYHPNVALFEATKPENHSDPFGTGNQVVDNLKEDFDFTAC